jgi:hypothetical protein
MQGAIREMAYAVDFKPFIIQMVDGRAIRVDHRDFISVPPHARQQYVIVYDKQGRFEIVNTSLAVSIRLTSAKRRAG